MSENILLAYGNKATGATLSGGQWESLLPLNNLKDGRLGKVARTSGGASVYNSQFRFDLAANYVLRALALVNHNLTTNALWRLRTTEAAMDMDFVGPTSMRPRTLTTSGGANGTRVNIYGQIEAATCPRYDFSPVNLASGTATQTISSVPAGTYLLRPTGSNAAVMASGPTVSNSGTIGTWLGPTFVVVTATGDVTLTVLSAATAIHFRESLGLLVEEARTNATAYSEDLSNAAWPKNAATISVNAAIAPSGATTADKLVESATSDEHFVACEGNILTANVRNTVSVFAKAGERSFLTTYCANRDGDYVRVRFDLATGGSTVLSAGANVTVNPPIAFRDGWWRLSYTVDGGSGGVTSLYVWQTDTGSTFNYLGDGSSGLYLWGAQCEVGAFPTTYIPTTSAAVTRTADSASITGSNFSGFFNATAGTLITEFEAQETAWYRGISSLNASTDANCIQAYIDPSNAAVLGVVTVGVTQASLGVALGVGGKDILAFAYAANDFAFSLNGASPSTDSSGTLPSVSQLSIGAINGADYPFNGHIRRIAYWPTRRTNAELQTITTSGPDAIGIDTGWKNALQMTFHGDTPTDWGAQYPLIAAFDATTVRYGTIEIDDITNPDGYVELGQLFVAGGFQPEHNAEYQGFGDGRTDLSSSVKSVGGQKYSTARRRPRTVDFNFPILTQDEGDHLDEMMAEVGTTEDVLYVPDPADPAHTQRWGFLGTLQELSPLEYPLFEHRATAVRIEQKL